MLIPFSSRSVIVNVLMQAGIYFQQAACSPQEDLRVAQADEKLALHAYMEAISLSGRSAPDLEIYTHINCLKFIAAFKYQDKDLKELVETVQRKTLLLADIFPMYIKLQANIDFLKNEDQTLLVLRSLLHQLVQMIWANNAKVENEQCKIDYDYIDVLYQAYEACVKNWFEETYNPALENKFRLELMELLLNRNGWKFSDLDPHLITRSSIEHDEHGWMQLTKKPLKIAEYGTEDHFCSLEGFEINHKTGSIKFTFSNHPNGIDCKNNNYLTLYDLTEMLEFNVALAHFSLDQVDPQMKYHPFNAMRFAPKKIYHTQFLNTMLLSDYILKFLTTGQEVQGQYPYGMRKIETAIAGLPEHLKKIIYDFHKAKQYNAGSIHRFWIEAEQATEASLDDDFEVSKVAVSDIKMVVKKHTMERDNHGNLVDTQKDHEGWKIYIFTDAQKREFDNNPSTITGPAIIFVPLQRTAFFIEKKVIYKEESMPQKHVEQLEKLATYERDSNNKIKTTIDNSMLIYDFINDFVAGWAEEPTHFSPEYVFAQEFTKHYDEFSEHILEFARLRELSKITVAIRLLNGYKSGAEQKAINLKNLLNGLPNWEQKDTHHCNYSSYFDLPDPALSLTEEERDFAIFKHKNIKFIKKILPKTIYEERLANLIEIFQPITVGSDEVTRACNEIYNKNADEITRRHGSYAWRINSNRIWNEICDQKAEIARQLTDSKQTQLQALFHTKYPGMPLTQLNRLINNAMRGMVQELADVLARQDFVEAKKQIQEMIETSKKLLEGFKTIGLAKEDGEEHDVEFNLDQECLWVPASVHHHVAENSSCFVYGGVRVMPRINSIERTNQNFNRLIGNAFNSSLGRTTVTSNQINRSSATGPQQVVRTFQATPANVGSAQARVQPNTGNSSVTVNTNNIGIFSSQQPAAATASFRPQSSSTMATTNATRSFQSSSVLIIIQVYQLELRPLAVIQGQQQPVHIVALE